MVDVDEERVESVGDPLPPDVVLVLLLLPEVFNGVFEGLKDLLSLSLGWPSKSTQIEPFSPIL